MIIGLNRQLFQHCIQLPIIYVTAIYIKSAIYVNKEIIILKKEVLLNLKDLKFPMSANEIKIFENNNLHISVNLHDLYAERDVIIGPYYHSKEENFHRTIFYYWKTFKNFTMSV